MSLVNQSQANQTVNSSISSSTFDRSLELEVFKMVFQTFIAIVGVLGNFAVCVVVTRNKHTKSSTELLIRNLAIADLGILLVIFPLAVMKERIPFQWPLGKFFCFVIPPASETFYGVSVWTIVVIAVERYRHLVCPVIKERPRTIKIVKRLIFCLWIGCFLIFSAPFFPFMRYIEKAGGIVCGLRFPTVEIFKMYNVFLLVAWYCLPLFIILWSYIAISRKLNQSNVFLRSLNTSESNLTDLAGRPKTRLSVMQQRRLQQNRRVKKILTPVVVAFAVLMLPLNAFKAIIVFHPNAVNMESYSHLIYFISTCIILNSSINPVIYSFVSPGFRAGLWACLRNKSITVAIVAGSAIRAVGEKMSFKLKYRRSYALNNEVSVMH